MKGVIIKQTSRCLYIRKVNGGIEASPSLITGPAKAQRIVAPSIAK